MSADRPQSLVVFSDDWGRHPSSCQHLVRQLLPEFRVLWVNTIGTRTPRLDWNTVKRVAEKLKQWRRTDAAVPTETHASLEVINPRMWPWFTRAVDRRFNAWLLERQLTPLIRQLPGPVTALTTLPITADLTNRLPVDRWVYYCVDDFGEWPGLDALTLRTMDRDMIARADEIVAVSEHLQNIIARQSRASSLLTHGVGPVRTYAIGAALLDLEDPSKVIGHLEHPLIVPNEQERDGYVPNVVYTCGALEHQGKLIIPYAASDSASTLATVDMDELMDVLLHKTKACPLPDRRMSKRAS